MLKQYSPAHRFDAIFSLIYKQKNTYCLNTTVLVSVCRFKRRQGVYFSQFFVDTVQYVCIRERGCGCRGKLNDQFDWAHNYKRASGNV